MIDAGGPVEPLFAAADRLSVTPSMVLLTHHHFDHVSEVGDLLARWPQMPVLISPLERDLVPAATDTIDTGDRLTPGELVIRPLHTPGHTVGMLSFLVEHDGAGAVFTGDTLFRDSVGGVRAPGHTTYQALKDSIMGTLMELDPATEIHPGHSEPTTRRAGVGSTVPVHPHLARPRSRGRAVVRRAQQRRRPDPCSAPTTTAATRRGCAGPTGPTTSSPARESKRSPSGRRRKLSRPPGARPTCGRDSLARWPARTYRPRGWCARRRSAVSPPDRPSGSSARARRISRAATRRARRRWPAARSRRPGRADRRRARHDEGARR